MPTYSTQFVAANLAAGWQQVYTAPSTGTIVLRDVELTNTSGAPLYYQSQLQAPGGPGIAFTWGTVASAATFHWEGRVVLKQLEQLWWNAEAIGMALIVSGYDLA